MKTKYILLCFLCFCLLVGCAYSKSFSFAAKEPQWSFYGEGLAAYVTDEGRGKDKGSMWLSTDWGETQTAFFKWDDLTPGLYKVITYVRAKDIQPGTEGTSFWHFYDSGFGTQSPFMDLNGSYDWRKVEYTINVKGSELTVWFRLKSPGQIWVDDFYLEKVENAQNKVSIEPALPLPKAPQASIAKMAAVSAGRKKLYTFEGSESGHPFAVKNKAGEFSPQQFFNFKPTSMPVKDWSGFDRLEMDVFNPNDNYTDFFATLTDDQTTNYWSQTNYKQTLAPGWNKLSLSLTQYVGERGSYRFQRPVNLSKLQKFFIVVDPDKKLEFEKKNFMIDNIYLSSNPMPPVPAGVMAFDFTSHRASDPGNLIRVTSQDLYNNDRGYGFESPKFWRIEDSQYASAVHRYSIGLTEGHFKIKLPNGKYQMNLVIDKLGYWDVPFWADRNVFVNGNIVFKETRGSGKEFLNDLLRFESVVPEATDHPYDLYLKKVFKTIDQTVEVTNGYLDLEFSGDQTGISLNSLILWNKDQQSAGLAYVAAFGVREKNEFDWMSRSLQKSEKNTNSKLVITAVDSDLYLNPFNAKKSNAKSLRFIGGAGERPYQVIQLASGNTEEKISWSYGDFTNEKGQKIDKDNLVISDLVFQYTAPDINHETYLITGKYLKPMADHSLILKKNQNRYLWLQLPLNDQTPKGLFKGVITFHQGSEKTEFPVEISSLSYSLPKVEFPVGFFGIDPLPYSYFPKSGYSELRKQYRHRALRELGEAGFTTFTGLPEDIGELNDLFRESSKYGINTVYSYGGQFPQKLLDLSNKPGDLSEDDYYKKAAEELKPLLGRKDWPKIVHTFSDEAGGYSDRTSSDIALAAKYKQHIPFMALGGFGSFHGGDSNKLNSFFEFGFYSSLSKGDITKLKNNNQRWGFYNASAGNLDDPRFSFGLGLYIARLNGLSQYLEWHATAFNNYPYYDFDGRESDSVMFYPTTDGKLLHSVRFELATEGLHAYKKLKILETAIANNEGTASALSAAKSWLDGLRKEHYFYSSTTFMSNKKNNFREFESKLDEHLINIFLKK